MEVLRWIWSQVRLALALQKSSFPGLSLFEAGHLAPYWDCSMDLSKDCAVHKDPSGILRVLSQKWWTWSGLILQPSTSHYWVCVPSPSCVLMTRCLARFDLILVEASNPSSYWLYFVAPCTSCEDHRSRLHSIESWSWQLLFYLLPMHLSNSYYFICFDWVCWPLSWAMRISLRGLRFELPVTSFLFLQASLRTCICSSN